jgi:Domain of unknown function (DUF5625)
MRRASVIGAMLPASCGLFLSLSSKLDVPFEAGRRGAHVDTTMRVLTSDLYTFYLVFQGKEGDRADVDRVQALAGIGNTYAGREEGGGIPVPVRLRVDRVRGSAGEALLDREFSEHPIETSGTRPSKAITRMRLAPGKYRIKIEALEDIPELAGTPVRFKVQVRPFK